MNETQSTSEYKLSSYNSAGNTIKRLDSLWEIAHRDVRNGNYLDWNIVLDRLWLEVAGDLKLDSIEHKQMNDIIFELIPLMPLTNGNLIGFNKRPKGYYDLISKQYLVLRKKEMLIKFMENKLGMGKAYVDEFEDDWE